jgi:uncharacterized protein (TIGR03435 family)
LAAVALPAILATMLGIHAGAQSPQSVDGRAPTFEVASIRPSRADGGFENYRISNARFHVENAPLTALIRFAYDIRSNDQLPKDPAWIEHDKFDIDAKVDDSQVAAMASLLPDEKLGQYRLMLQSLLEDRFELKVSRSMKELPVYALVVAKVGPKLSLASVAPEAAKKRIPTLAGGSKGALKAADVSMALFSEWLSGGLDTGNRVVIDATGLKDSYDFTLNWTPDQLHLTQSEGTGLGQESSAQVNSSRPALFTSLQEQLGLKLESRRAQVEILVIDRVEKPSQN